MMKIDYDKLDHSTLIELLAQHTSAYTRLMSSNGNKEELRQLKNTIDSIQKIIQSGKVSRQSGNMDWASPN